MTSRLAGMPRLLVLTDRSQLPLGRSLTSTLAECVDAGLTHVVLRELDLGQPQRAALARRLTGLGLEVIAARRPLPLCCGTHLAAEQPLPGAGPFGRSCHSREEVERAGAEGATWATLSPYALTRSKPGHGPPLPSGSFAGLPVQTFALGGVAPANAGDAIAAGAHGVAVMGAVMRSADPAAVVAGLLREVGR